MNIRNFLEQTKNEQMSIKQLYEFLVENLSTLFVLYIRSGVDKNPMLTRGKQPSQFYVAAFTDQEAANQVRLEAPYTVELIEESALPFLTKVYRGHYHGIIFNPGLPSHFFIKKDELRQLVTEYAVEQLSNMPGAWIPTMSSNMLLVEYQKNAYTVAIYANKEDAEQMCREAGGTPILHQWNQIFERAKKVNAQSLYLHFHLPEQVYLSSRHIEKIWKGKHRGFEGHTSISHSYHVQTIDQAQKELNTTEPQQEPVSESVEAPVEEPQKAPRQPATGEEKSTNESTLQPIEATEEDREDAMADPQQEPNKEPQVYESNKPPVVSEEKVNPVEPVDPKEIKQLKPTEKNLPSERVNPYSIKNKKSTEFDIYLGDQEKLEKESLDIELPSIDSVRKSEVSTVSSEGKAPLQNQSVQSESKQPVNESQPKNTQPKTVANKAPIQNRQPQPEPKEESIPQGNQGLAPAVRHGLERLERATIEGQGMANGWEVCQVLAEIRRIWIIVDQGANMVILAGQDQSPIVDFFTSDVHAQRLIQEAHQNNPSLPPMSPQLVSTRKLYRALSPRQPIIWINRGSRGAWTSVMGDTLPYVMQLMTQLEKEKI